MPTLTSPVQTVNIYEAKTKLSKLVDLAAAGQEIIIARNGKPVARLAPAGAGHNVDRAREAARRIRERADNLGLGRFEWGEWKGYRDEGRQ